VTSLPGRDPDTLAGLTGNVIFTEFGLFPNGGYDHWRVVFPLATRGFQVIVISTPRGKNTRFYELCQNLDGAYSVHVCDIHQSIREDGFVLRDNAGQPTDLATFKKLYGDASGFEREYECRFTGDASSLITWAELERAAALNREDAKSAKQATKVIRMENDQGATINTGSPLDELLMHLSGFAVTMHTIPVGWDVARRGHLSVVTINAQRAGMPMILAGLVLMRNCSFDAMRRVVSAVMDCSRKTVGFGDATGLGMESNETLQKKYGDRWTPFTFTAAGKREIASALKTAFADGTQTIPPLDGPHKFVATDLYAIQKDDTGASLVLSEGVNPLLEESHCDIAYALGLARLAGAAASGIAAVTHKLARHPSGDDVWVGRDAITQINADAEADGKYFGGGGK
jgi:phage FluMu gp28-like protein